MSAERINIAVGIATAGRCDVVSHTLELIARQSRLPNTLVICPAAPEDVDLARLESFPGSIAVVKGGYGLTKQRNEILASVPNADVIVFFDDDFFPRVDYLAEIERIFALYPDIVAVTGRPIQDGANGPGLSVKEGLELISRARKSLAQGEVLSPTYGAYGCNMGFRLGPIREHNVLFDENLPLYGWQEDIDFSRRLAPYGRVVESDSLRGIHLGTKRGRSSGVRFGYAQVANPVYLFRKGTMSRSFAGSLVRRNIAANFIRCLWPEPWIDRKGRLKGNFLALIDIALGRSSPHRILGLD